MPELVPLRFSLGHGSLHVAPCVPGRNEERGRSARDRSAWFLSGLHSPDETDEIIEPSPNKVREGGKELWVGGDVRPGGIALPTPASWALERLTGAASAALFRADDRAYMPSSVVAAISFPSGPSAFT